MIHSIHSIHSIHWLNSFIDSFNSFISFNFIPISLDSFRPTCVFSAHPRTWSECSSASIRSPLLPSPADPSDPECARSPGSQTAARFRWCSTRYCSATDSAPPDCILSLIPSLKNHPKWLLIWWSPRWPWTYCSSNAHSSPIPSLSPPSAPATQFIPPSLPSNRTPRPCSTATPSYRPCTPLYDRSSLHSIREKGVHHHILQVLSLRLPQRLQRYDRWNAGNALVVHESRYFVVEIARSNEANTHEHAMKLQTTRDQSIHYFGSLADVLHVLKGFQSVFLQELWSVTRRNNSYSFIKQIFNSAAITRHFRFHILDALR